MAKDRRGENRVHKTVTKRQFQFRLLAFFAAIAVAIVLIAVACSFWGASGSENPPLTTTASSTSTTVVGSTTSSVVTTASQSTAGITETAAAAPTTTPTAAPVTAAPTQPTPSSDGHYVQSAGAAWNLRLVNKWNQMTQAQSDQLPIAYYANGEYCDSRMAEALSAMLSAGSQYGLYVTSGYRSYGLQEELFENKIYRVQQAYGCGYDEAAAIAATEVARPGTSEHNTGLAVDLLYDGCWELERYWEDGEAFDWMMAHCAEYGFILRFPDGAEDITGVIYEPWHYRYVGVEAATDIMSRGITLEQYLQERGL